MRKHLASVTPVVTMILLEGASVGQIIRIWAECSAKGQSISSWVAVLIAQAMWFNFYRVKLPDERLASWSCVVGMAINAMLVASIVHWRAG